MLLISTLKESIFHNFSGSFEQFISSKKQGIVLFKGNTLTTKCIGFTICHYHNDCIKMACLDSIYLDQLHQY